MNSLFSDCHVGNLQVFMGNTSAGFTKENVFIIKQIKKPCLCSVPIGSCFSLHFFRALAAEQSTFKASLSVK